MQRIVSAAGLFPAIGRLALAALAASLPIPSAAQVEASPAPAQLVIRGGILLDMVSERALPRPIAAIVVRDGKLAEIIEIDSEVSIPDAVTIIDARNHYILPAFFDAHVHFRPFRPDAAVWKRASNHYGITTLFDTGPCGNRCAETGEDANEWIIAWRDFMNAGPVIDGPTLYVTGRRIQGPDGTHPLGVRLGSKSEIAGYLDQLGELGADGVKVESTLAPGLRAAVVEEASARGLPVVGHSRDAAESIAAGMKFIEHMWPITSTLATSDPAETFVSPGDDHRLDLEKAPALIDTLVRKGVYVNPTLVGRYGYFAASLQGEAERDAAALEPGGLYSDLPQVSKQAVRAWWQRADDWDNATLQRHRQGLARVRSFLRQFSEAGGRVLVATDSGADKLVGTSLHREMVMLGEAGIAPYRILLGATRWPAEMTGKLDRIGTIETGKDADVVIFSADPSRNIHNSRRIAWVINQGVVLRRPDEPGR